MKRLRVGEREMTAKELEMFKKASDLMDYVNEFGNQASEDTKKSFTIFMMQSGIIEPLQKKYILTDEEADKLVSALENLVAGIKANMNQGAAA